MSTHEPASVPGTADGTAPAPPRRWRTVDIVVAAVVGVTFGVVFALWNNVVYPPIDTALGTTPLKALVAGVWLIPAVVGALIVRKPGAALFTELLAATVSMLFGSGWGLTVFLSGVWQGLGAELVFALFAYRRWGIPAALLAGGAAGLAMGLNDVIVWYPAVSTGWKTVYVGAGIVTGAVIAGALGWWLVRALARTGALAAFAAGRGQAEV